MATYLYFGLSITTFEVNRISVVKFFISCLVSEILKDKKGKRHKSHAILNIKKKSMTSEQGKILFL